MKKLLALALLFLCTAAFGQQKKLVVPPFENRGAKIDAAALNNLQDFLINVFINTGRFQVPDRNALALLATEQKFQLSDWADDTKSAEMGKVLNADYIVRIIAVHDGETNVLMARILDVNTANGLSGQEMEFSDQRDARSRLDDFVKGILQRIGGSAGRPQGKLVVPPFENRGVKIDAAALNNMQDFLINSFINTGRFQVPDRNALDLLAKEQHFQLSDWADDAKSAQMGKVLNADYIARIIVIPDGASATLMMRILDVSTANGLSAAEMEFTTQRDARGRMNGFVGGILQRIGGSAGRPQGKLVVTPFENRGVTQLDTAALNNMHDFLINAFINNGRFQVPDRSALDLLAKEQHFQLSDWADDKKSAEMGRVLNADYIARIIVIPDGASSTLMMRILDVNTANGLSAAEMEFTTQRDARGKMEGFVRGILQRIVSRGPSGGWIFYDKGVYSDGWRYLEAAPAEMEFNDSWAGAKLNVAFLNLDRKKDWFIPSKDELDLMYKNLKQKGLGEFSDRWYWSSSQYLTNDAWGQNFDNGSQGSSLMDDTGLVRAIRAF